MPRSRSLSADDIIAPARAGPTWASCSGRLDEREAATLHQNIVIGRGELSRYALIRS